jgi:hypothetical protein
MRGEATHQRQPLGAEREEAGGERIEMPGGALHHLDGGRVVLLGVASDDRGQRGEIARRGVRRPAHDGVRIGVEFLEQALQQAAPGDASVTGVQDPAHRRRAEPGAAALIRQRQPPAADPIGAAIDERPADAAGPGDDDAALAAAMRADAGGMCVGGNQRMPERQPPALCGGELQRLARTGEREAGGEVAQCMPVEPGRGEALPDCLEHCRERALGAEAQIGRAGNPFAEHRAGPVAQPRPAARPAPVDADKKLGSRHVSSHLCSIGSTPRTGDGSRAFMREA